MQLEDAYKGLCAGGPLDGEGLSSAHPEVRVPNQRTLTDVTRHLGGAIVPMEVETTTYRRLKTSAGPLWVPTTWSRGDVWAWLAGRGMIQCQ